MATLKVMQPIESPVCLLHSRSPEQIKAQLAQVGVIYEHRSALGLDSLSADDAVRAAAQLAIDGVGRGESGWKLEVSRVAIDASSCEQQSETETDRARYLAEHFHEEDEVWIFVRGRCVFYVRDADTVYVVLCEKGDCIRIPAFMKHWFDMGASPEYCGLRLYRTCPGFVGTFTGNEFSNRFPLLEEIENPAADTSAQ